MRIGRQYLGLLAVQSGVAFFKELFLGLDWICDLDEPADSQEESERGDGLCFLVLNRDSRSAELLGP